MVPILKNIFLNMPRKLQLIKNIPEMLEVQMVAVAKLEASYYVEAVKLEAEQLDPGGPEDLEDQAVQESDHLVGHPVVHMEV